MANCGCSGEKETNRFDKHVVDVTQLYGLVASRWSEKSLCKPGLRHRRSHFITEQAHYLVIIYKSIISSCLRTLGHAASYKGETRSSSWDEPTSFPRPRELILVLAARTTIKIAFTLKYHNTDKDFKAKTTQNDWLNILPHIQSHRHH